MGTATFGISQYGRSYRGVRGKLQTSGAHTTSTTATNLTDGAAGAGSAITGSVGDVLTIQVDEAARVQFGGVAATATSGQPIFANETTDLEIPEGGTISIIDIA